MPTEDKKPDLLSGTDVESELAKINANLASQPTGQKQTPKELKASFKKLPASLRKSFAEFTNGKLKE